MAHYTNAALTSTEVATPDVMRILSMHGVNEGTYVTSLCLVCQSITVSPDAQTKALMQRDFDMTCCSPESTIHVP